MTKIQEHGTDELPTSGIHDPSCKWLCRVPVGTSCTQQHSCSKCATVVPVVMHMAIDGPRDSQGRAAFTMYWSEPAGVFRADPSKHDGEPVGYRRAQVFRAIPEEHLKRGNVRLAKSEAAAIAAAWQ